MLSDELKTFRIDTFKNCANGSKFGYFETWINNDAIMNGILVVYENDEFNFEIWKDGTRIEHVPQSKWNPSWKNTNAWHLLSPEYAPIFEIDMLFPTIIWSWNHPLIGRYKLHETKIKTQ